MKVLLSLGLAFSCGLSAQCIAQTAAKTSSAPLSRGISTKEREALIAIYKTTDGDNWKNHARWIGAPGTECSWYGVECGPPSDEDGPYVVNSLNLLENGLKGQIPEEAGKLTHLEWLTLGGNSLSGVLPAPLIRRWLSGSLRIIAEAPLFTTVSEVDFEDSPSSVLCGRRRIILRSDETAVEYDVRCRNATPDDRTTFCEVRHGQIFGERFAFVAHTLDANRLG